MPRKLRLEHPGAICQKRGQSIERFIIQPDAPDWSLRYHLALETPNANLVAGMAWLQSAYTIRLNHRHKLAAHLLSGCCKAQLVEGSGNGYLRTARDYVAAIRAVDGGPPPGGH